MPRELVNALITHVSLVDKGANGKQFAIIKSNKNPTFQKRVEFIKSDEEKRLVTGIVYEPDVEDSQGDFMTADSIEKAAHQFLQEYRQIDKQHNFEAGYGEVVESYVAKSDHQLGDETIKTGTWVMTVKVSDDESWEAIKKGEVTGFSMGGIAETIQKADVSDPAYDKGDIVEVKGTPHMKGQKAGTIALVKTTNVYGIEFDGMPGVHKWYIEEELKAGSDDSEDMSMEKSLFRTLKAFFNGEKVTKGAVSDKYNKSRKNREFWAAQDALNSVLFRWDQWDGGLESDPDTIREALQDFIDIAQEVLIQEDIMKAIGTPPAQVIKSGKKISAGNLKHVDDAIAALTELKNKTAPVYEEPEEEDDLKAEDIAKAVTAALAPIAKQVEGLTSEIAELKKEEGVGDQPAGGAAPAATAEENALTDAIAKALAPLSQQMQTLAADVQLVKNSRGASAQGDEEEIQKSGGAVSFGRFL